MQSPFLGLGHTTKAWHMTLLASQLRAIFPHVSSIQEHGECVECVRTRAWVTGRTKATIRTRGFDHAYAGSWLEDSFKWGANVWPLYWCELSMLSEIDCGAFASLFSHCLEVAQVPHNHAQVIFGASQQERAEWETMWRKASASTAWILDGHVYHESVVAHQSDSASLLIDTTDMMLLGDRCDDPRYTPVFIRVAPEGWRPASGAVAVAGRFLRVGLWESWESA